MAGLTTMALIAGGAALAGGATTAYGQHEQGKAMSRSASVEAEMQRRKGMQELALSQERAKAETSEANSLKSNLIASASAFGGGTTDKSVLDIYSDISEKGEYNKLSQLYAGNLAKQDLDYGAELTTFKGRSARRAGNIQAFGTILDTASSMASMAGSGGKDKTTKTKNVGSRAGNASYEGKGFGIKGFGY